MRASIALLASIEVGLCASFALAGEEAPVVVSPGSTASESISDPCPTFSWGLLGEADKIQLVVYRVEGSADDAPAILVDLPGVARTWTTPLTLCLERAVAYAWSVRRTRDGQTSQWARPRLFEISAGPSAREVAEALEVLRRVRSGGGESMTTNDSTPARPSSPSDTSAPSTSSDGHVIGSAQLTVQGEVRTVDSTDEPVVWGRGRPNAEAFGPAAGSCPGGATLSWHVVDWASAAHACPAGTRVCRQAELGACNTTRPDDTFEDALGCDGSSIGWASNLHIGWVADGPTTSIDAGDMQGRREDGSTFGFLGCTHLPVWCCPPD